MSEHLTERYHGSSPADLRLILLGNIGCGKTSSADTILGHLSPVSGDSKSCQVRQGFSHGRSVTVVEAPRWYWSGGKMEDSIRKETERAMTLVAPGPHAVLVLVPIGQFTEMEGRVPAELEELFGEEVLDHTIVLLTCGDYLMRRTVEMYLQSDQGLRQMIENCGGRYHVLNNRQLQDREQVRELLQKVDSMMQKKGVYVMKTEQEKELETQKQEHVKSYRGEEEDRTKMASSWRVLEAEMLDRVESINTLERMTRREETDSRVDETQIFNGLHAAPVPEQPYSEQSGCRQSNRPPSFAVKTVEGATHSQISDGESSPKIISTVRHRIDSFEEKSPEASPSSSLHSPVISPTSHASPTFATSPSSSPFPDLATSSSLHSNSPELRLVLLGRSRAGKSAAGNSILGQEAFESHSESFKAITQKCEKKKALVEGRRVAVVDTPDWFNSEETPDEVRAQISSCIALSSPGPHAFLLCVPVDQPAKIELQALGALETIFGPEAVHKYTMVLFTYTDQLRKSGKIGDSVEGYIASQRRDLVKLVEECGDRFHVMERGRDWREKRNVVELLEKVEQTVKEAGGRYYSCPAFQEAESRVKERQLEIAKKRMSKKPEQEQAGDARGLSFERNVLRPYMQPVAEVEEDVMEAIEKTRDEAEMSVSTMNINSLPPITLSTVSPSLLHSIMEKMSSSTKNLPKLLGDSSAWLEEGAKNVKNSPVWGTVGSGAQNVQKIIVDSSMWQKMGTTAGQVSKAVGDRVPKVVVDGSAWVGSGAKAVAASPVWEQVGSGAKSGAKLVADSSVKVGAGIGAGAKVVAQSPVWGKMGSGAKAGAKMVAKSSVWEKVGEAAKKVPKVVIVGTLLGLVLGVVLWGMIGGAIGAAAGSAVTEVGRRKFSNKTTTGKTNEGARNVEVMGNNRVDEVIHERGKSLKTE
ncbi:uncharacterized protein LOC121638229 isoform X1 [Melanotaenia boesemani]|uniref:uncharacterized protein LOC121638229 isoform X1 n=1 Tax=Melanotaenia boesemani TaxID=1250792 RepID=UPI001C042734|nr:uncharacterized protein LOC121638229 isoform X1 [Melanotaenia boesemani]